MITLTAVALLLCPMVVRMICEWINANDIARENEWKANVSPWTVEEILAREG